MTTKLHLKMSLTREIPYHNEYTKALLEENLDFNLDEERAPSFKGHWRSKAFETYEEAPIDLEVGTGNGFHFAYAAESKPERHLIGLELKYKPLIQTVRRALKAGSTNFKMLRYDASHIEDLFEENEINNIYLHFPDPWPKKRHWKNRLIREEYLNKIYKLQRPGSFIEFKTDHFGYFDWALEEIKKTEYKILRYTEDLHHSEWADANFPTHFEKLWTSKGLPIHYILLQK